LSTYYQEFDKQSIKVWIINIINSYLEIQKDSEQSLIHYGILLLKFKEIEYEYLDKLLKNYFGQKFLEFVELFYQ